MFNAFRLIALALCLLGTITSCKSEMMEKIDSLQPGAIIVLDGRCYEFVGGYEISREDLGSYIGSSFARVVTKKVIDGTSRSKELDTTFVVSSRSFTHTNIDAKDCNQGIYIPPRKS